MYNELALVVIAPVSVTDPLKVTAKVDKNQPLQGPLLLVWINYNPSMH